MATILVVSDSIGETGESVARAAAAQFNGAEIVIRRITRVSESEDVAKVIEQAKAGPTLIVYTAAIPAVREMLRQATVEAGIPAIDVLGPVVDSLEHLLATTPRGQAGLVHKLDDDYFQRVEAVEFAVKYDDGKDPRGLFRADVVLIGVSRTSKTPVSLYLAQRRYKVANVPLVPEVPPPQELFQIPSHKVVGLTVSPEQLASIRQERVRAIGLRGDANYASMQRILDELDHAEAVMRRVGCPVVDVTHRAVEETAQRVLEIIRKGQDPTDG